MRPFVKHRGGWQDPTMSDIPSCVRVVQARATQGAPGSLIGKLQQECAGQTVQIMHIKIRLLLGAVALLAATPLSAIPKGDEPIAVPRTIRHGIDFVYVDPQMSTVAKPRQRPQNWLQRMLNVDPSAGSNQMYAPNPLFVELARGLQQYRTTWGQLPQVIVPGGAALKRGSTGKRMDLLRTCLGLSPGGGYDEQLFQSVASYQGVHGLGPVDGVAGKSTIASLNQGAAYYSRRIAINLERTYRLPTTRTFYRYVDGAA